MNWSNGDEVEELSKPECTHYAHNAVAVYFCPFPLNVSQCFQGHSGRVLGCCFYLFICRFRPRLLWKRVLHSSVCIYIYCIAVYYRLQHHVAVLLKEMSVLSYSTGDSSVFIRPKRNKSIIVLIKSDGSI